MTWFAAHVVMAVKFKSAAQRRFPVWENVVLVNARSESEAFQKAESLGRDQAGDDDGTFRWGGKHARWEYVGVRKIVECATLAHRPGDGDELTFNELEFDSVTALEAFAHAKPATVHFSERYRELDVAGDESPVKRKRKRA